MNWIEVAIKTTNEGSEIAAQFFYEVGAMGVVIEDPNEIIKAQENGLTWDYIDESLLPHAENEVIVKGYLNDDTSLMEHLEYIKERKNWVMAQDLGLDLGSFDISLENVNDENWIDNWKKYYKPVKASNRIVIKPSWEDYSPKADEKVLELDPGMAFGTGTHETTLLCIRAIDKFMKPGSTILDIGCGTGVLGIAAVLLGASSGDAVDIDESAVKVARENAAKNKVEDKLNVIHGDLLDKINDQYDFITANIIADVIIGLSGEIDAYLKPGGIFVSSGIILERLDECIEAIEKAGLEIIYRDVLGEWAAVVSRKNE